MRFRPDIEGLRAIAVLAVVVFHARLGLLSGGFVGVDVFFTLSGYLITGLLLHEYREHGRLRLGRFYARRARRLLPASAAMTLSVVVVAALTLGPDEQRVLARVAISVFFYSSNLLFAWVSGDYFGPALESNPLTHTWSLAVEEQFYFLWPLLLWGALRIRRAGAFVLATTALTLPLCIWLTALDQPLAFFLSPARAWEFSLGACGVVFAQRLRFVRGPLFGGIGLALLLLPIVLFSEATLFPGYLAVLPTLGTLILLLTGSHDEQGWIQAGLRSAPAQEVGRLSYSLYLWHWPALVLAEPVLGHAPSAAERIAALGIAAIAAKASFHLLEQPLRHAPWLVANARSLGLAAVVMALGSAAGAGLWARGDSLTSSGPLAALTNAAQERPMEGEMARCHLGRRGSKVKPAECTVGPEGAPTVLLFGDSHAQQWFPALEVAAQRGEIRVVSLTKSACAPVLAPTFDEQLRRPYRECAKFVSAIHELLPELAPDLVIATGRAREEVSEEQWREGFEALIAATEAQVVLVEDSPTDPDLRSSITTCAGRALVTGRSTESCSYARPKKGAFSALLHELADRHQRVHVADLTDLVCTGPQGVCEPFFEEQPIWRDRSHVTASYIRARADDINAELLRPL